MFYVYRTSNGLYETRINLAQLGVAMLKKLKEIRQYLLDNPQKIKIKWLERFDDWCDDCVWAIFAFLMGRLFLQAEYRPDSDSFRLSAMVRYRAVKILLKFWEISLMTEKEYDVPSRLQAGPDRMFALYRDINDRWRISGPRDYWERWNHPRIMRYGFLRKGLNTYIEYPHQYFRRCLVLTLSPIFNFHARNTGKSSERVYSLAPLAYEGVLEIAKPNTSCPDAPFPNAMRRRTEQNKRRPHRHG